MRASALPFATHYDFGSLAWAESTVKVEDKVIKAVRAALTSDKYLRPVLEAYSDVFEKNTPLKLKRFGALRQLLLSQLLPKRVQEAKVAAEVLNTSAVMTMAQVLACNRHNC